MTIDGAWENAAGASEQILLRGRADGSLLAYLAGDPGVYLAEGSLLGTSVTLDLQGEDGGGVFDAGLFTGNFMGALITGTYDDGSGPVPLTLQRSTALLLEEHWLLIEASSDEVVQAARLTNGGTFFGGGFVGLGQCNFLACGGGFDDWSVAGTAHTIQTSSGGSCSASSTLLGDVDPTTSELTGTYTSTNCVGTTGGDFFGGKAGLTTTAHINAVLMMVADLCDALEAESATAIDGLHSTYLHDGMTRADWGAEFATWYLDYDSIEAKATLTRIITVDDGEVHPYLQGPDRLDWHFTVSGVPAGGGATETFFEYELGVVNDSLHYLGTEGGKRVFVGNGEAQPLSIGLPIQLADVSYDSYVAWPFGVHGGGHVDDGHPGIDFSYLAGSQVYAVGAGEIVDIRPNTGWPLPQWDITQRIRTGVSVQYGHIADPPSVIVGDVLALGDVIGNPSSFGGPDETLHFALRFSGSDDVCPVPWFNDSARADWDTLWAQAHYSEELCEPLDCNDRDAPPPYTATWDLETAGTSAGPDSIYFFRLDGDVFEPDYTFFDTTGASYESGHIEWMTSPSTIGLKFIEGGTGVITYGAADIINDEMQFKLDTTTMPTDMIGAAIYRYQQ
jgi:hypothetical protein